MKEYRVMKEVHFCYGHRLLNYDGKCQFLHGHNARVQIILSGKKCDKRGMVVDFGDIERLIKTWLEENLDHKTLLSKDDSLIKEFKKWKQPVFVMDENPTAEAIAKLIYQIAAKNKLPIKEICLWETPTSYASYSQ